MYYAILDGETVVNVILGPLPNDMEGVPLCGRPVAIGDVCQNGTFLRNGQPVLTDAERISALEAELSLLREQLES